MTILSAERMERLRVLYVVRNLPRETICEELRITDRQLSNICCRAGWRRPPKPVTWDLRRQELLVALLGEKLSSGEIGRRLGISRNAVIGRCHRLGLPLNSPKNLSPEKKQQTAARAAERARRAREKAKEVAKSPPMPEPAYALPRPPTVNVASIHFLAAGPGLCRFPLWDHSVKIGLVCGKPVKEGTSWCPDCSKRCYTPGYVRVRR